MHDAKVKKGRLNTYGLYLSVHIHARSGREKNYFRFSNQKLIATSCATVRGLRSFFYDYVF
jgi:hypothetical protein